MKNIKINGWHKRTILGFAVVSLLFLIGSGFTGCKMATEMPEPPVAEKIPKELTIHGDTRVDDYYWLNERDNPQVIDYLNAENEYKDAVMKHTESFQKKLYDEIVGRIKKTDMSVPSKDNGYYYYSRYEEGGEY